MTEAELDQIILNYYLEYKEGELYHKRLGKRMGTPLNNQYLTFNLKNKRYLVHRAVYVMHHGVYPETVDHINNDRSNNKIENLRGATQAQNNKNASLSKRNTSGVKGIAWIEASRKWKAKCMVDRIDHYLGMYESMDDAVRAVSEFRVKHHGEFACHG